ncbi:hypothetical protein AGABI2DRAFT_142700 [Agaricus bisporus var. bisporus H97]|uniref:hypothetical protein n=1 Tax=Agaricus bisporus var. bisporus (strain H97 / ATCC MYA-4626 / FGSC 10389) TaxID=936046 RepID=UPI00029F7ABC|nr:hypothetical protein AGABI2DRAFT_142700 [Agaricus bisporus var. bisporus H97]EKV48614.1 hypothetical protein AGABI2DRAFT_142700 [Agaricus bisporus var. bisporus H97]
MSRARHSGPRKLILAFNVGTTFSGIKTVFKALLRVTDLAIKSSDPASFPGQEMAGGTAKLPSIIYYDKNGKVRAVGAEAEGDNVEVTADEENWHKVECDLEASAGHLKSLPLGKTVVEVLSDFLKYLKTCAEQYIQEVHPGIGSDVWDGREIHYILSHPNGWGGTQHTLMREAAQNAGLVWPRSRNQLSFITEGEARLYCCMEETEAVIDDQGILLVHAGSGTIDISAYARNIKSDKFEEIAEAQCHFKGSTSVTNAFEDYLRNFLKDSKFREDIPCMKQYFDKATKYTFRDPRMPQYIRFGSVRDRDDNCKIIAGKLRLEGTDVASFFEPSVERIVDGVLTQCSVARKAISHVFLVGGFAASDYLYQRVKDELQSHGLAVADGAISGILAGANRNRVSRYPLGIKVSETQEFRTRISHKSTKRAGLLHLEEDIICYRGDLNAVEYQYMDNDPGSS